ncbi:hypothetical protein C8Q76DRAFT_22102 [Earliella scabrosa]|nr:hypothetical protein C8Q76DRAFT_22102 [Earliella scabrosa]
MRRAIRVWLSAYSPSLSLSAAHTATVSPSPSLPFTHSPTHAFFLLVRIRPRCVALRDATSQLATRRARARESQSTRRRAALRAWTHLTPGQDRARVEHSATALLAHPRPIPHAHLLSHPPDSFQRHPSTRRVHAPRGADCKACNSALELRLRPEDGLTRDLDTTTTRAAGDRNSGLRCAVSSSRRSRLDDAPRQSAVHSSWTTTRAHLRPCSHAPKQGVDASIRRERFPWQMHGTGPESSPATRSTALRCSVEARPLPSPCSAAKNGLEL